jgi:hypothetical protein
MKASPEMIDVLFLCQFIDRCLSCLQSFHNLIVIEFFDVTVEIRTKCDSREWNL